MKVNKTKRKFRLMNKMREILLPVDSLIFKYKQY